MTPYECGREAFDCLITSKHYTFIKYPVDADVAVKIFFPPVKEMNTMISSPLPRDRQQWMKGFKERQEEYFDG